MKDAKKALAKAEAAAKAKKASQQEQPAEIKQEEGEEEEPEEDEEVNVTSAREGLNRADTQDIEQAARVRKAYKARKERFYRSLKSVVLSSGFRSHRKDTQYIIIYFFCMLASLHFCVLAFKVLVQQKRFGRNTTRIGIAWALTILLDILGSQPKVSIKKTSAQNATHGMNPGVFYI